MPVFSSEEQYFVATYPLETTSVAVTPTISHAPENGGAPGSVNGVSIGNTATGTVSVPVVAGNNTFTMFSGRGNRFAAQEPVNYYLRVFVQQSSDNTLASLTTDAGVLSPPYNPDTLNYLVRVFDARTAFAGVTATANDAGATVTLTPPVVFTDTISVGTITVNVTAANGDVRQYNIRFNKQLPPVLRELDEVTVSFGDSVIAPPIDIALYPYIARETGTAACRAYQERHSAPTDLVNFRFAPRQTDISKIVPDGPIQLSIRGVNFTGVIREIVWNYSNRLTVNILCEVSLDTSKD